MNNKYYEAAGRYDQLKREVYELGIKAQAILDDIQAETETLLSGRDFNKIDFDKVIVLCRECKAAQASFAEKAKTMEEIANAYGIK